MTVRYARPPMLSRWFHDRDDLLICRLWVDIASGRPDARLLVDYNRFRETEDEPL